VNAYEANNSPFFANTSSLAGVVIGNSSYPYINMTYSRDEQEGDDPAASSEIYEASSQVTCLVYLL
jgi:hypothetical protein